MVLQRQQAGGGACLRLASGVLRLLRNAGPSFLEGTAAGAPWSPGAGRGHRQVSSLSTGRRGGCKEVERGTRPEGRRGRLWTITRTMRPSALLGLGREALGGVSSPGTDGRGRKWLAGGRRSVFSVARRLQPGGRGLRETVGPAGWCGR